MYFIYNYEIHITDFSSSKIEEQGELCNDENGMNPTPKSDPLGGSTSSVTSTLARGIKLM